VQNCYEVCSITGTGEGLGAFIGGVDFKTTDIQSEVTFCIAWHASLDFYGYVKNAGTESGITNNFKDQSTSMTISTVAQSMNWSADIWDFSGNEPKLK
jgi:hypothetical protein